MTEIKRIGDLEQSDTLNEIEKLTRVLRDGVLDDTETTELLEMPNIKDSLNEFVDDMLKLDGFSFTDEKSYNNFKSIMDKFGTLSLPSYSLIDGKIQKGVEAGDLDEDEFDSLSINSNGILIKTKSGKEISLSLNEEPKLSDMTNYSEEELKSIKNLDFLSIPFNERLKYITKDNVDSKDVASGDVSTVEFKFTFDGKYNKELYLKTTAGQVLPQEVGALNVLGKTYKRAGLNGEFFDGTNRLIIGDKTVVDIELRTEKDIENIVKGNDQKVKDYMKENSNSNEILISEAINRGIDPKFAEIAFGKLITKDDKKITVQLEDAFTEFDREVGRSSHSRKLVNGKQSGGLALAILAKYNFDNYKTLAKEYGISDSLIKQFTNNGSYNLSLSSSLIQNADSLPNGEWLRGKALLDNPEFSKRLDEVCENIGANRSDLIMVMEAESGIDPRAVNPSSKATGLIQFMPDTAKGLFTKDCGQIRAMTGVQQLDLVEKYLKANSMGKRLNSVTRLYQAVFFPKSLKEGPNYVYGDDCGTKLNRWSVANQNRGIANFGNTGFIDQKTFTAYVTHKVKNSRYKNA